jgi:hypothetical protein
LNRTAINFINLLLLGCIGAISLLAQDVQVSGRVTDTTGAVIPKAKIEVRNQATSASRSTTTNADGLYVVPFLTPGTYTIAADAGGFKRFEQTDVQLDVAQQGTVDLKLEVGTQSDAVTVSASAPLTNTSDASVSTVVDRQFVENLPLNGRSLQSLIALSPGVVSSPSAETGDQGQLSVAGQRAGSNYFTIDGVSANFAAPQTRWSGQATNGGLLAFSALGSTNSLVSVDALQEFRLETSTYAPEFGRESGAQAVLVTRSGTNRFHGSGFDYLRNDAFNANDWFANSTAQPKPRERQNDFGGVLGGPIVKDKTFFFFSYEGLRAVEPNFIIDDVPSLAARAAAPPNIQTILNGFPLPNGPSTGVDLSQLAASASNSARLDATSLRIDHALNSKMTLFGRYDHSPSHLTQAGCNFTLSMSCQKGVTIDTGTLGFTTILTPTITNDFHFNYSRASAVSSFDLSNFGGAVIPPMSSLFPSFVTPSIGFSGIYIFTGRNVGLYDGQYSNHTNRQANIIDTVEVSHGTHSMKFGFDFRRLTPTTTAPISQFFDWSYGGNPMPALISGEPPDYSAVYQGPTPPKLLFHNFSAYAQDNWKVSRRLTLTYGLRWDYNPPPTEASGNTYAFNEVTNLATATLLPKGSPLWHGQWKNFAPRVGASYLLRQSAERPTVVRVGFGQFYDLGTATAGFLDNGYGYFPYSLGTVLCNYGTGPDCTSTVPYGGSQPPYVLTQPYVNMRAFDPHLKLPYSLEWNIAIEQALSANQTFKVTYLGSAGRNLLRDDVYGNANPIVTTLYLTRNTGYSNYDALQLQYQRRLSRGLQALISYSWSHSLDTNSSDVSQVGSGSFVGLPSGGYNVRQDYGNSDFDIRQAFSAAVTYNLPATHIEQPFVRAVLNNWSIDSINTARTGMPFDVEYNPANPGPYTDGQGDVFPFRPNVVPGQSIWTSDSNAPGGKVLNAAAFTIPSALQQGTESRNSIRGFPLVEIDLAIRRQFNISERVHLQFRAEGYNIINHPNFGNPLNNMGTCAQGSPCTPIYGWGTSQAMLNQSLGAGGFYGSGFGSLYQVGGPRSLQLSMKILF